MATTAHNQTRIILGALKANQTLTQWESDFISQKVGWDDLSIRAIVFGLAPLLHHRFSQWGYELPGSAAVKLAAIYQAHVERNQRIIVQLGEVLASCTAAGLHPLALKGVHLCTQVYPEPALRPMNDIDLLFPPREIRSAEQILEGLGYSGKHKSAEVGAGVTKHTSTFQRVAPAGSTPNPYLSTEAEAMVEPHTSLEESWFGLKVDITPGIRKRARLVELAGYPCQVLEPTDLLLHLCVHFCFHLIMGTPAMVQLLDLSALIQKNETDWAAFTERTTETRAEPFTLASLTLAVKLLDTEVPASVITDLKSRTPRPLVESIAGMGLATILKRTQQTPLLSLRDRLSRGLADRRETARWAPDIWGRFQVWKTLLTFWRTDTGRILLRKEE